MRGAATAERAVDYVQDVMPLQVGRRPRTIGQLVEPSPEKDNFRFLVVQIFISARLVCAGVVKPDGYSGGEQLANGRKRVTPRNGSWR